jgi:hypothetical protein
MSKLLPPANSTAAAGARLRLGAAVAAVGFAAAVAIPAGARPAPVRVLIGTTVSTPARDSMSTALWAKLVAAFVNAEAVPLDAQPTLEDCAKARAAYMVSAPFELRPRLPGVVGSSGRVAAQTHIVVTNCITGQVPYDKVIPLDSDPPSSANAGDFESVPETSWARVAPQELARYPVFFPRVARVRSVTPPFALIDAAGGAFTIGDTLRAFATANGEKRALVLLTVTSTEGKYVQVVFSTVNGAPVPQIGDYVEPAPQETPPPK